MRLEMGSIGVVVGINGVVRVFQCLIILHLFNRRTRFVVRCTTTGKTSLCTLPWRLLE